MIDELDDSALRWEELSLHEVRVSEITHAKCARTLNDKSRTRRPRGQ